MNQDIAISVEGISKKFPTNLRRSMFYGAQDVARDFLGLPTQSDKLRKDEFWAVRDVSFELKRGDTLGIVGPNGSGKSTLLKMLNGIIKPDKGSIRVRGRVGALIEVGAGFHPMLTGRENIYINGAILGMSRSEINRKFDSIVSFADIGDFLDMPVKNYSSGMYVRLGFAVAAHSSPDILLVDEVLAVGDVAFQKKCFQYIENDILKKGVVLCLVSHNIYTVARLCSRAILLNHGTARYIGESSGVVSMYYQAMRSSTDEVQENKFLTQRLGAGEVRVTSVEMMDELGREIDVVKVGSFVGFKFQLHAVREMAFVPQSSLKISDQSGTIIVYSRIPNQIREKMTLKEGINVLTCSFYAFNLIPGKYVLEIKIGGVGDLVQDIIHNAKIFDVVAPGHVHESTGNAGVVYIANEWKME